MPTTFWMVRAVVPASLFLQLSPVPQVAECFLPANLWTSRANIIQRDFVMQIGIVPNAVSQCLINAVNVIIMEKDW
jgi:hypothetical protein